MFCSEHVNKKRDKIVGRPKTTINAVIGCKENTLVVDTVKTIISVTGCCREKI
uniref:Uncharacterized protein n=1 Tax=Arion vulgaris TaxID=1028688 RepID=A0A0B7BL40_9EUPU